jgi:hypothetical protein
MGSIFVEMMVNFLVVHITKSDFLAHQRLVCCTSAIKCSLRLIPSLQFVWAFTLLPINLILGGIVPEDFLLIILSAGSFTYTLGYLVTVFNEFAAVIEINVFRLGRRHG